MWNLKSLAPSSDDIKKYYNSSAHLDSQHDSIFYLNVMKLKWKFIEKSKSDRRG